MAEQLGELKQNQPEAPAAQGGVGVLRQQLRKTFDFHVGLLELIEGVDTVRDSLREYATEVVARRRAIERAIEQLCEEDFVHKLHGPIEDFLSPLDVGDNPESAGMDPNRCKNSLLYHRWAYITDPEVRIASRQVLLDALAGLGERRESYLRNWHRKRFNDESLLSAEAMFIWKEAHDPATKAKWKAEFEIWRATYKAQIAEHDDQEVALNAAHEQVRAHRAGDPLAP